ncbi:39S ribosomal protein L42, mitochondrial [Wyeomyia smithii]|uniref:39S ribosomal protein L42, mitochondrial n=1 Tax=Wyeomyia smithii TaxID=174621 RepID=UPI002467B244|nr:39S ribosomal protein L42, mitochondrial [Wyeomyia smithii]
MSFCRNFSRRWNHFVTLKQYENVQAAQGNPQTLVQRVTPVAGGKCFLAWHPKPQFPYEYSKPINPAEIQSTSSLVRDELVAAGASSLKAKHPEFVRSELARVTYTTKHRWFPRARDKKAKTTPMDREYL